MGKNPAKEDEFEWKSFGKMFWIPDGCNKDGIKESMKKEENIWILKIEIPKGNCEKQCQERNISIVSFI